MAKTIATDIETYRRAVAFEAINLGRPSFPVLSETDARALAEGDPEIRAKLASHLIARELWEQDAPSEFLAANSYGFAIQHKSRERLYKLAAIEGLSAAGETQSRSASDSELLALLAAVGVDA